MISEKFNKYYDFTLLEYYRSTKPVFEDFKNGMFFGTRDGSWECLTYAVDKQMIACKYIDSSINAEFIGNLKLIDNLGRAGYAYVIDVSELLDYYLQEISIRIEKSKNAEKFPDLAFMSKHLVEMGHIIKK